MQLLLHIALGLLPVSIFLVSLIFLDSFKLIKPFSIVLAIAAGGVIAFACYLINDSALSYLTIDRTLYTRYISPVIEEGGKALYIIILIRSQRVGFMVDAAVYGFAVGAGFAFVENIYYLQAVAGTNVLMWITRGFGTAVMHGGTTAIFGIISKSLSEKQSGHSGPLFLLGLLPAIAIHSLFNHFLLPPIPSTLLLLIVLPALFYFVYKRSEQSTREWLGVNLDADMELLALISTGNLSESRIGQYLYSLKSRFSPEVLVDMLCLLRIHTELSVKSKGVLMMREAGFESPLDPEVKEKFSEMTYLEKSIGATGKMAILPFLHTSSRSLWQLYMLKQ
ncbi:MAG TPA: PrsW family glutamic-type intramembrane protease [Bacteroidota bacterium]|nr:PrsW family glutamic-type intramembrane protease [Bacteroidota bacterium]